MPSSDQNQYAQATVTELAGRQAALMAQVSAKQSELDPLRNQLAGLNYTVELLQTAINEDANP